MSLEFPSSITRARRAARFAAAAGVVLALAATGAAPAVAAAGQDRPAPPA